jgi:hypothetical protein
VRNRRADGCAGWLKIRAGEPRSTIRPACRKQTLVGELATNPSSWVAISIAMPQRLRLLRVVGGDSRN